MPMKGIGRREDKSREGLGAQNCPAAKEGLGGVVRAKGAALWPVTGSDGVEKTRVAAREPVKGGAVKANGKGCGLPSMKQRWPA